MVELFISDLDGTLLDPHAQLSPVTRGLLEELTAEGLPFSVASARTPFSVLPLLAGLELTQPLILMNGALIYDPAAGDFPHAVPLDGRQREALVRAEAESGMGGLLFTLEEGHARCHCAPNAPFPARRYFDWEGLARWPALRNGFGARTAAELGETPILYGMYLDGRPEVLAGMAECMSGQGLVLDFYRDVYTDSRWYLEVYSARASKGAALDVLRNQYGFSYVVGFGDGENDLSLLAACDEGYAVANACPALKAAALGVIGGNKADGVAVYLKERWKCETHSGSEPLFSQHRSQVPGVPE